MADENTNDSQNSTTDQQDPNPAANPAADSSSSTTTAEEKPGESTILGTAEKPEGDTKDGDKPAEEKPAGEKGAEENALLGAPEGDYEITGLPDGTSIDKVALDALTPVAKEIGLSNVGMSKLAETYASTILPHVTDTIVKDVQAQAANQAKAWDAESRLAVEGGKDKAGNPIPPSPAFDGKPFDEVRAISAKAIDRFAGEDAPALRKFLDDSGLGNNQALLRFAYTAGKAIKEDDFVRADTGGSTGKQTMADVLGYSSNT